ncbi:hypothetical protein Glove_220g56 [Diversispora epigaea]|uniref:Uncharacterized protein n=1 Tax=Diversispora epigaea TaxID=1348612 RepID=A0A397INQ9_9GLOM|nr:hypothetical protein Glove_220g56 [Diversispora epigaea]
MSTQEIKMNAKLKEYEATRINYNSVENNIAIFVRIGITQSNIKQTTVAHCVIEWISYDQFENVKYLAEGRCATIYIAIWKDGQYIKWNSERQILERFGEHEVVLKKLNNSNGNNLHWFQVTISFTLDNASQFLDPTTQDYMLVLKHYNNDLRHFLKDNYHSLSLTQKYQIIKHIAFGLNTKKYYIEICTREIFLCLEVNQMFENYYFHDLPYREENKISIPVNLHYLLNTRSE